MLDGGCRARRSSADGARWRIDREIDTRRQHARSDECHHGDERLHEHPAVADETRVTLARQEFRRSSRRNERVKAAYRTTRNRDERKWKNLAREYWSRSIREL